MTTYYYDPHNGDDANAGTVYTAPKKTLTAFSFSGGAHQYLQKAGTTYTPTAVTGSDGAVACYVSGTSVAAPFVFGVYDASDGSRITGTLSQAWWNLEGSEIGLRIGGNAQYHLIEGLGFKNLRRVLGATNPAAIAKFSGTGKYLTIRYCEFKDICADVNESIRALYITESNTTVEHCYFHDISNANIAVGVSGSNCDAFIARHNRIIMPSYGQFLDRGFSAGGSDCIQILGDVTNFCIEDNILDHSAINGKHCILVQDYSVTTTGTRNFIRRNLCIGGNMGDPVIYGDPPKTIYVGAANTLVQGNYVTGGEYGIFCATTGASEISTGSVIEGNLVVQSNAASLYGISLTSAGTQKAYTNTVVRSGVAIGDGSIGIENYTAATTLDIRDNIVTGYNHGIRAFNHATSVKYNCLYGNTNNVVDNTLASQTPDASNVLADPLLDTDYAIPATSPCHNGGVYIPGAKHFGGHSMSAVTPDIGAKRYFANRTARFF